MSAVDASRVRNGARWLVRQHLGRLRSRPPPPEFAPRDIAEAYAMQDAFVALKARSCGPVAGYKITLTTPQMRALVGLKEPVGGCLHARQVVRGPATVRASDYGRLLVEFEIAARTAADLPARGAPYTREQIAGAVGAVMPAFEIADDRHADYATLAERGLEMAADNAWTEGAVLGEPVTDWRGLDLAAVHAVAYLNGEAVGAGRGGDSMGHPLNALTWVANHLAARGCDLHCGDVLISGSLVTSKFPQPGDTLRFDAGVLGAVELKVI